MSKTKLFGKSDTPKEDPGTKRVLYRHDDYEERSFLNPISAAVNNVNEYLIPMLKSLGIDYDVTKLCEFHDDFKYCAFNELGKKYMTGIFTDVEKARAEIRESIYKSGIEILSNSDQAKQTRSAIERERKAKDTEDDFYPGMRGGTRIRRGLTHPERAERMEADLKNRIEEKAANYEDLFSDFVKLAKHTDILKVDRGLLTIDTEKVKARFDIWLDNSKEIALVEKGKKAAEMLTELLGANAKYISWAFETLFKVDEEHGKITFSDKLSKQDIEIFSKNL